MGVPKDIANIIWDYYKQCKRVEAGIDMCLNKYFDIEVRGNYLLERYCNVTDCPRKVTRFKYRVTDVIKEAQRVIDTMLLNQSYCELNRTTLSWLRMELSTDILAFYMVPIELCQTLQNIQQMPEYDTDSEEVLSELSS